jgi:hypothetical protein
MAVAFTFGVTTNNSNNASTYANGVFTTAANDYLLILGGISDTTTANITATDDLNLGWDQLIPSFSYNSGVDRIFCLGSKILVPGTTGPIITVDTEVDAGTGSISFATRVTGSDGTPIRIRQIGTATGAASTTPTVVMPLGACDTNNGILAAVFNGTNAAGLTIPTGWAAEMQDVGHNTPPMGGWLGKRVSGETNSTITWGSTSASAWGAVVVEVYAGGQGITMLNPIGSSGFFGL